MAAIVIKDGSTPAPASDARLKTDITPAGTAANGLPLYQFRYVGLPTTYEGVMAQDVLAHTPAAVTHLPLGVMMVNYDMLGITPRVID
ncbi:tail fiber domain-containing protein [Aliiroseovarius sp. N1Y82]|nr:tail fiber domain-containing protein [uncultured Aliiroseovarius sp.]MCI2398713.1 tail fiber domain-containing protein [Aliiroseovarius subalbicans]